MKNCFPHDSGARNDEKLLRLRMKWKAAGYGVYFMLLEKMREDRNYMCVKDYNVIAFDLREDAGMIKSVVEDFGLFAFTEDGKCFYSEEFVRRMRKMEETSEKRAVAGQRGAKKRWSEEEEKKEENGKSMANAIENDGKAIGKKNGKILGEKENGKEKNPPKNPLIREKEEKEKEGGGASSSPCAPAPARSLSFEDFRGWLAVNAPEMLEMRPPQQRTWDEVKVLYGTRAALERACQEIAANEGFRRKWTYVAVALRKWKELAEKLGVREARAPAAVSREEERMQKDAQREAELSRRARDAVTYEEWLRMKGGDGADGVNG